MENVKRFVDAHVIYCQSSLIDELLSKGVILNDYTYSDNGEVMEWWLVTDWLAEQLQEQNEIVLEDYGCSWWGRSCSGQAVYLVAIMSYICAQFD